MKQKNKQNNKNNKKYNNQNREQLNRSYRDTRVFSNRLTCTSDRRHGITEYKPVMGGYVEK